MTACSQTKILVLGISGMLGSTIFKYLESCKKFNVYGSLRSKDNKIFNGVDNIFYDIDASNKEALHSLFKSVNPDVVINCIGVIKQLKNAQDPVITIPINSILPHQLARLSTKFNAQFIHFSTDCVFLGSKGCYKESDLPDARDLYGLSKFLGEVDYPNAITLRTSIIGHELASRNSLVDWFLSQEIQVRGFKQAIFSGLPTIEIARVLEKYIILNDSLEGLYHLAARPINKLSLLQSLSSIYFKEIKIIEDNSVIIDRSLDASKLNNIIGYKPPSWDDLIKSMYDFNKFNSSI
ncbi:SDR family oxidoreductase [Gammaproteobacteria bacterium]|nr:SDR family oxidoreductase [Gammaproteobacteria bacterium]MDA9174450.1 SDR family oxidoreductase [Gammaproteobacteria bacterium]MDA9834616.1 SDR family oxidoreductase [Gammaproteobacteria bacterium]MDA9979793.1 SDR family oxidoreductase [Gammaproteobacteria bacterium]MDC3371968.1 SDR family oxidoreductase [Gammaproteobacteria bacterium]